MIRMIFSTVRAPQDPALTVESLAISATGLPSIVAVPVITPSAGSPSARTLAYRPSSVKLPSSVSSRIRSRAKSLPAFAADSWYFGAPPRSMPARTAARSECSATRGLYLGPAPGWSAEPFAHRVQPAGPGSRALDPPGGSRRAVPGQQPSYLPGGVEFPPDGDVEILDGPAQARDPVADGCDLAGGGPFSGLPGVDGHEPVPARCPGHRTADRRHPGHPAGGARQRPVGGKDPADPDGHAGLLHRAG